jgi:hypothetical protein
MQSMRAFVETISKTIEKLFDRQGLILPMYHVIERDGTVSVLPAPARDKDASVALVRAFFEICRPQRYLFVDEAWTVMATDADIAQLEAYVQRVGSLKDHPQRIEVVMFQVEDRDEGQLTASRRIVRPAKGKPRLGPLEFDDGPSSSEGRMVGLLPREGSLQ